MSLMPGTRRGFDPVFDPLAFPFCLGPTVQAPKKSAVESEIRTASALAHSIQNHVVEGLLLVLFHCPAIVAVEVQSRLV
jgi:hypothetical protein